MPYMMVCLLDEQLKSMVQWQSRVRPPTCFSLKIVLKLIYLDNVQYLTEHLTAAQLRVSTALYTKAIRAAVINSFKVLDLETSVWKQLVNS